MPVPAMLRHAPRAVALVVAGVLLLAGCSATSAGPAGGQDQGSGEAWSHTLTGYEGRTIETEGEPVRVVADAYSAAALWDYGIRPVGVFGYGLDDGSSLGEADASQMEVVGTDGELSLEKLLTLEPDLVIGFGNTEGTGWTWWEDTMAAEVERVAPFVPIQFGGRPVTEVIAEYRSLAEALGGDVESGAVTGAEADFEAGLAAVREAAEQQPDLKVAALSPTTDIVYFGQPSIGQVQLLAEQGVTFTGPTAPDTAWAEASWEDMPDMPVDLVLLLDDSDPGVPELDLYQQMPAVQAGQVFGWNDKRPFTYASYATWLSEFAAAMTAAEVIAPA